MGGFLCWVFCNPSRMTLPFCNVCIFLFLIKLMLMLVFIGQNSINYTLIIHKCLIYLCWFLLSGETTAEDALLFVSHPGRRRVPFEGKHFLSKIFPFPGSNPRPLIMGRIISSATPHPFAATSDALVIPLLYQELGVMKYS